MGLLESFLKRAHFSPPSSGTLGGDHGVHLGSQGDFEDETII